jgi:hypothetical protein
VEAGAASIPWTKRLRHYTRGDLATSLTQSLAGYGPDAFGVQPAERVHFAVQISRQTAPTPSLVASIPLHSPERRRLLEHGWQRSGSYCLRTFADAASAVAAILDAYAVVYGPVGDEKGWNIVTPALRPRTPWPEPWTGEEQPVDGETERPHPFAFAVAGRGTDRRVSRAAKGVFGVAVGLFITWAALQSFIGSAHWTVDPEVVAVVLVGCVVISTAVALSGVPDAILRRGEYAWGRSIIRRAQITFAFAALPAIAWALVVITRLGTPPR